MTTMNTSETYLILLKEQLTKIEERTFNLSSWKKATTLLVSSCFGPNSPQVSAIEKIDYNYSSWALRDESGTTDPVKTDCKATLNTIIKELELLPQNNSEDSPDRTKESDLSFLWLPFEDELTGSSLKKLKSLLSSPNVNKTELEMFLKDLPGQTLINIMQNTLLSPEFRKWISQ